MAARAHPQLRQVVLDCTEPRALAEFYRELLGWAYRPGDEQPDPNGEDWLVLQDGTSGVKVAFQQVPELLPATWPQAAVPQQLHLDLTVPSIEELSAQHDRVLQLGGHLLLDRLADPDEPLRVYADPAGHPFCIFVADQRP